jgi:hypothetical protein
MESNAKVQIGQYESLILNRTPLAPLSHCTPQLLRPSRDPQAGLQTVWSCSVQDGTRDHTVWQPAWASLDSSSSSSSPTCSHSAWQKRSMETLWAWTLGIWRHKIRPEKRSWTGNPMADHKLSSNSCVRSQLCWEGGLPLLN